VIEPRGVRAVPFPPPGHLRPPSRRGWVAVTLLVALTVVPMLVVILAGRVALRDSAPHHPHRADGPPTVIIQPGPSAEPAPQPSGTAAPHVAANPSRSTPQGVRETTAFAAGRAESTPCPPEAGRVGGARSAGPASAGWSGSAEPPARSAASGTSTAQPTKEPEEDNPGQAFLDRVWDELGLTG
jgi:hypothetical protein